MPRIPRSGEIAPTGNVTRPIGLPGAGLGVVAQLAERAGVAAFAVEQARAAAQRQIDLNQRLSAYVKGMDDLQVQADAQTDPQTMRAGWYEGSQKLRESISESLADPLTRQQFEERSEGFYEQRRLGIEKGALSLTTSIGQATTETRLRELAMQAANAPNDLAREEAFGEMGQTIRDSVLFYRPDQLADLSRKSFALVEGAEIINGTAALQAARTSSEASAIALGISQKIEASEYLGPLEVARARAGLAGDLRVSLDRIETQGRAALLLRQEEASNQWVKSIFGATPETLPSVQAILTDERLSASGKEHYASLLGRVAKGESINATSPAVANDLWRRIHDPASPNPIITTAQLEPYLGNGIGLEDAEKFRADVVANQGIVAKQQSNSFAAFLKSAENQITQATPLVPATPQAADNFYQFRFMAQNEWERVKREKGDPVETLLNPSSDQYLGKKIAPYRLTQRDYIQSIRQSAGASTEADEIPSGVPEGSRKTGQTSNGKAVWISPDGKMWVE